MKISGIYKIVNKVNGKYYVGYSKNIYIRWRNHKLYLNKGNHKNTHLQNSWNKYGSNNFDFILLENIPENILSETEQKYLNIAKNEKEKCYNKSFISDEIEMTPEVIDKVRESNRRRIWSKESLLKLSIIHTGQKHSEKTKEIIRKKKIGKHLSKETIKKISKNHANMKGDKNPMYGRKRTLEQILKITEPLKDKRKYSFKNLQTNETFTGTRIEFQNKYYISKHNIYNLIHKKVKSSQNWVVIF